MSGNQKTIEETLLNRTTESLPHIYVKNDENDDNNDNNDAGREIPLSTDTPELWPSGWVIAASGTTICKSVTSLHHTMGLSLYIWEVNIYNLSPLI
jgi:hypothetical protein